MEMAEKMIAYFSSGSFSARTDDDFADLLRNISGREINDFGRLLSNDDAESVASSSSLPPYTAPGTYRSLTCLQPARMSLSTTHFSAASDCPIDLSSPRIKESDVQGTVMNNQFSFPGTAELAAHPYPASQIPSPPLRHTDLVYINSPRRSLGPPLKRPSTSPASRAPTKRNRRSDSVSSRNSSSTTSSSTGSICLVCGAPSTGKHFEIECCDGCKAFFRRSVRSKREYNKCKFDGKCGKARCIRQCRSCRLQKCIAVGMNANKVQYERDKMPRKVCRGALEENSVVGKQVQVETDVPDGRTTATLADVADYLSSLTPKIFRWAKEVPGFERFSEEDQSALISLHCGPYLIVEIAMKSLSHRSRLLMGERHVIRQETSAPTSRLGDLISREILNPLRDLNLDETEFLYLKSILLFDATTPWVADKSLLQKLQMNCFAALQRHVGNKFPGTSPRFGQISFLINAFNLAAYELSSMLRKAGLRSYALN